MVSKYKQNTSYDSPEDKEIRKITGQCGELATSLRACAMFLEGKAHLFRSHNVFDDAQEYSDLAQRARKVLAVWEAL